jgi:hypothetical protein
LLRRSTNRRDGDATADATRTGGTKRVLRPVTRALAGCMIPGVGLDRMRIRSCILVAVLGAAITASISTVSASAGAAPTWERRLGRGLEAAATDAEGAVYVTGWIWAKQNTNAMVVAKFGPSGRELWRRTWRRQLPGWYATGTAIATAPGGGVYVGAKGGYGEGPTTFVFRYSSSGRLLWRRPIPGTHVRALIADRWGVVAAVQTEGPSEPCSERDGHVAALSPNGEPRWSYDFEAPRIRGTYDVIGGMAADGRGSLFVSGTVDRSVCDPSKPRPRTVGLVQRLTRAGAVRWSRIFSDPDRSRVAGVIAARGGRVVVSLDRNPSLVGLSAAGRRLWAWWGRGDDTAIEISSWGPVYVGGGRYRPAGITSYLRRFSPRGELVSEREVAVGPHWLTDVATSDVVYVTVGRTLQRWPR